MSDEHPAPEPEAHAHETPAPRPAPEVGEWRRLDPRLIVIGPVTTLGQFAIPLVLSAIGIGTQSGWFALIVIPVALVSALLLGALPYWTTTYRETPTHVELRSGLLSRKRHTAPRDRVRSVDITTPLLHRLLGVTKVEIGTGVDDNRIELPTVSRAEAERLQAELLGRGIHAAHGLPAPAAPPTHPAHLDAHPTSADGADHPPAPPGATQVTMPPTPHSQHSQHATPHELARLDWSWLRFAPLNLAQLAIVAGALGAASQFLDDLPIWDLDHARSAGDWVARQVLPAVLAVLAVLLLLTWLVISLSAYVLTWFGFRLTREPAAHAGETSLHLTAGLLTTRSTSVEERRVRGVRTVQPALMRLVGGGDLATLATGVEDGTTKILPHCPMPVVLRVGNDVLGAPDEGGPLAVTLRAHPGTARRRAHIRWQWLTLFATAAATAATVMFDGPWWPPVVVAVALAVFGAIGAELSYRNLGHALTFRDDGTPWHLVAGSGGYSRVRTVLEVDGIIGWVFEQSFLQRRAGLLDLVVTTAAGPEHVRVRDIPEGAAAALSLTANPSLVRAFTTDPTAP